MVETAARHDGQCRTASRLAPVTECYLLTICISVCLGICRISSAAEQLAPAQIQQKLDRRAALLQQFLDAARPETRVQLAEEVREIESALLQQTLPQSTRLQLLDEHNGLLSWLAEQYDLADPAAAAAIWNQAIAVRSSLFGEVHWQVKSAEAERSRSLVIAQLSNEDRSRLGQAEELFAQASKAAARGDLATAEKLQTEVANIQLTVLGRDVLTTAIALRVLGHTMLDAEKATHAQQILSEAASIAQRLVGPHPVLIGALGDLAAATHMAGETQEAARIQVRVARMAKEVLGEQDLQYATAINNLSLYVAETGDVRQALRFAQEANRIYSGQADPDAALADNFNLIGNYSMRLRQPAQALTAFQRAIELQQKAHGDNHPYVAVAMGNAAMAAIPLRKLAEAESWLTTAIGIFDSLTGSRSSATAEPLLQLATLRRAQGRTPEAEPLVREACRLIAARVGEEHPAYALAINQWAVLLAERGDYAQAEALLLTAIEIQEARLGSQSQPLAASLTNLARVQARMNHQEMARDALKAAGQIALSALEQRHPEHADQLRQAARIYRDINEHGLAKTALTQAVGLLGQELGEDHPEVAHAVTELGTVLIESNERDRGQALFQKGQQLLLEKLGESHPDVLEVALQGARLQRVLGHPEAAASELLKLEKPLREQLGTQHEAYGDLLIELGKSWIMTGQAPRAEQSLQLAARLYTEQYGAESPDVQEVLRLLQLAQSGNAPAVMQAALAQLESTPAIATPAGQNSGSVAKPATLSENQQRVAEMLQRLAR
ncbi:tetratricopeptide repeat protein [Planctomicrobium sp. SH664]|uniref:tetratricopeptide repeat protein n=1 Tax=Planctomicrobium sp. SH664 TaxID=3448125 RepID=UPI003F5C40CC